MRFQASLEEKVFNIVRNNLGLRANRFEDPYEVKEEMLECLKKTRIQEFFELCRGSDTSLLRIRKPILTAAIRVALAKIRTECQTYLDTHERNYDDDYDDLPILEFENNKLIEVQNTNQLNKSVVELWNINNEPVNNGESGEMATKMEPTNEMRDTNITKDASTIKDNNTITVKDVNTTKRVNPVNETKDTNPVKEPREKKPRKRRDKVEKRDTLGVSLSDLGGIDAIISQVLEMIAMPLTHPEIYKQIGCDIPRGVLLHGPPGCGKTRLANALANELGVAFISVSAPSVVSGMSGESEKKLRDIFEEARSVAPSLIFIDEIDAITPKRESVQREMERRIVAQLLTCMDDMSLDKTNGNPIIVIGATNRPDAIDAALRRGGRFDREICITVPDQEGREQILRTISKKLALTGDFDYKELARLTPGYVGADLHALVAAAGVAAIKRIFKELQLTEPESLMDLDTEETDNRSLIRKFLDAHPDTLTEKELAPLSITFADFLTALPEVQPSSKREGFATVPDVTWNDVGAMQDVREELEYAIVEPIRHPDMYKSVGISAPSGVLLWGPPGCGKTLLAKAVANESQANFISIRGPELLNKYVGESERAVRQVFVRARASVPCVIFFDELDALVPRRDDTNSEATSRVVNTLLTELDGMGDRNGVYIIAATNRPDMIDSAMLRPGRLDKQLYVDLPSAHDRAEILHTVTRKSPLDSSINLSQLANDERCRNFSGADLSALVREAAVISLKDHVKAGIDPIIIRSEHFDTALSKVKPSVSDMEREKYKLLNDQWGK